MTPTIDSAHHGSGQFAMKDPGSTPSTTRPFRVAEQSGSSRCGACGETFGSLSAFDLHRVGPMTDRQCLSAEALEARGLWRDGKHKWRYPARTVMEEVL